MTRQKAIERRYLDEARHASSIFPPGEYVGRERPDFLLAVASGSFGIEMTELCREEPRRESGRLLKVAPKAKTLYSKRPDAKPVDVSAVFSQDAHQLKVGVLAKSLDEFVHVHHDADSSFRWPDVPKGYIHVGVFPALLDAHGRWREFVARDTVLASQELIAERIDAKNAQLPEYRKVAAEVWLLIVNDLFLGHGEVCLRAEDLAQWTFDFAFDKALLFERQPGGSGKVIELRRRQSGPATPPGAGSGR